MKKTLLVMLMVIGVSVCVFANDYSGEWTSGFKTYTVRSCYGGVYVTDDNYRVVISNGTVEKINKNCIVIYYDNNKKLKLNRKGSERDCEAVMTGSGLISGAAAGALVGAKIGIVAGPLGGIAGTIPGAIIGGIIGGLGGNRLGVEMDKWEEEN